MGFFFSKLSEGQVAGCWQQWPVAVVLAAGLRASPDADEFYNALRRHVACVDRNLHSSDSVLGVLSQSQHRLAARLSPRSHTTNQLPALRATGRRPPPRGCQLSGGGRARPQ